MLNFVACVIFWVHEIEKRETRQFCLRNNSFSNCTRMQIISKVEYTVTCFEFTYIRRIALIISYSVLLACWTWTSQPISYQNATRRLFKTVVDVDGVIALYQLSPIPYWDEALELFYFVYIPFEITPCRRKKMMMDWLRVSASILPITLLLKIHSPQSSSPVIDIYGSRPEVESINIFYPTSHLKPCYFNLNRNHDEVHFLKHQGMSNFWWNGSDGLVGLYLVINRGVKIAPFVLLW